MTKETKEELVNHMIDFGLHMLGKGLVNATFNEMMNPYSHAMAIVHIGHGTELIIKAKIAEEHPLLIFSNIPKSTISTNNRLGFLDLLEKGQTIAFNDLPERLWASTGYKIKGLELFNQFGKVRNQIIHLGVPPIALNDFALKFGYGLIEPMVNEWWGDTILQYAEVYDEAYLEYVFEQLNRLDIESKYELDENYHLREKSNFTRKHNYFHLL
ncbi:hypothetical protein [Pedobacter sp. Leaf194]|uniref:hypothetical protein n=1 Tax=Pedobacter sp. Leaf194 TaxID=1736297 RepID=UPI00070252C8|nr:hypothetical protein [Pedobacter sp. Leaf194]KQS36827.1 hypothetical protein ASG14_07255 [Pedobacter sp. Leaf194]